MAKDKCFIHKKSPNKAGFYLTKSEGEESVRFYNKKFDTWGIGRTVSNNIHMWSPDSWEELEGGLKG